MANNAVEVLPPEDKKFAKIDLSDEIGPDRDLLSDYKLARKNLKSIADQGQTALDGILDLARDSDHPRAYEVAGQIIKNLADVNKQLIDLQKEIKAIKSNKPVKGGDTNINNALFVGTAAELQKLLNDGSVPEDSSNE